MKNMKTKIPKKILILTLTGMMGAAYFPLLPLKTAIANGFVGTWGEWSGWIEQEGQTLDEISTVSFYSTPDAKKVVCQAVRGTDNGIWTRRSANDTDVTFGTWYKNGETSGRVSMGITGDGAGHLRVVQAVRGARDNGLFMRYSSDCQNWSNWTLEGETLGNVTFVSTNSYNVASTLYMAARGTDNGVWTRYTTDAINWSSWVKNGETSGDIAMEYVCSFNYNQCRLFQYVKGSKDNLLFQRSTVDGVNWSAWGKDTYDFPYQVLDIEVKTFSSSEGELFLSVRDTSNRVWTRRDSVFYADRTQWETSGLTLSRPSLSTIPPTPVIQTVRGTDNGIWNRRYTGGVWSDWSKNGETTSPLNTFDHNGKLYQYVRGARDNKIFMRFANTII